MAKFMLINPGDNVAVCLQAGFQGEEVEAGGGTAILKNDIPVGHKVAIKDIAIGQDIIKYGSPIGHAACQIPAGHHVHTHNIKTNLSGNLDYTFNQKLNPRGYAKRDDLSFLGFRRPNGKVGIRNELWVVPTVGCVNGQAQQMVDMFRREAGITGIDAIEVFKHSYGCSQLGDDHENTRKALAGIINHPNAGGVLVLGLGCENNQAKELRELIDPELEGRVRFLVAQDVEDEVEAGCGALLELYQAMKLDERVPMPLSELKVGLKCGGSDGFSGITANPLVGAFSDLLVAQGGTTILTEVPEMFGAETILMERARNLEVFEKTVTLINQFKDYYCRHGLPIYENPSPGNKEGGISTLEDKSLGCTQKGGTATVVDVLDYAAPVRVNGLNLLASPGNDLVAASALGFSGCQLVLFTTGRGTPFGSFVPTMKISTNTPLFHKKKSWVDFNAGELLEGKSMDVMLEEFTRFVIRVANGEKLNHEKAGAKEIAIFKTGVTL